MNRKKIKDSPGYNLKADAMKFVLMVGVMSVFADFTYEGSRGIIGPYLGLLGLGATAISIVTGAGELLGYGLRIFSGRWADSTRKFWPIAIFGYVIQMMAVPLMALTGNWPLAGWLIIQERTGKAIRNPPRDVMLSHAAKEIGYGWAFGVHEALDQTGAMFGPLAIAGVLALQHANLIPAPHDYRLAFAFLGIPATITLVLLIVTWRSYPHPENLESTPQDLKTGGLPRVFWIYLAGAVLAAIGIGGFPLMAYHLQTNGTVSASWIPVFYAIAMGVSGGGSLLFGRLFDQAGMRILLPLAMASAVALPLVWLGGFGESLAGIALWGLGIGVQESLIPAAVATMVPVEKRASAFGIFTAGYGISLFMGSVIIGFLYNIGLPTLIAFGVIAELAAIPVFFWVSRRRIEAKS